MPIRNFPFTSLGPFDSPKPYLPVKIFNPDTNQSQTFVGIVDTGASGISIPGSLAQVLGHNLHAGQPIPTSTPGGACTGYMHTTRIEILNFQGSTIVSTQDRILSTYMPDLPIVLLGVTHFLEQYNLHIDYPKRFFSIYIPP
jgi:hypothetical protein